MSSHKSALDGRSWSLNAKAGKARLWTCSAAGALRMCADQSARRLTGVYETYGVLEGATLDLLETWDTASDEQLNNLPFSEGDFRAGSIAISLALIEKPKTACGRERSGPDPRPRAP